MQNSTHPDVPGLDLSEIPGRKNEKIPADKSLVRKLAIQGEEVEETMALSENMVPPNPLVNHLFPY